MPIRPKVLPRATFRRPPPQPDYRAMLQKEVNELKEKLAKVEKTLEQSLEDQKTMILQNGQDKSIMSELNQKVEQLEKENLRLLRENMALKAQRRRVANNNALDVNATDWKEKYESLASQYQQQWWLK